METKELSFQEVFNKEQWLIHYCMRKLHIYKEEEEYYQVGLIGLWEAYDRFDETKGATFRTFAYRTIRGRMLTYLKWRKRAESREATLTETMVEVTEDTNLLSPLEKESVLIYCKGLNEEQKNWVIMRFVQGYTQREIAEKMQVSIEKVNSWRRYAMKKLRENMKRKGERG